MGLGDLVKVMMTSIAKYVSEVVLGSLPCVLNYGCHQNFIPKFNTTQQDEGTFWELCPGGQSPYVQFLCSLLVIFSSDFLPELNTAYPDEGTFWELINAHCPGGQLHLLTVAVYKQLFHQNFHQNSLQHSRRKERLGSLKVHQLW